MPWQQPKEMIQGGFWGRGALQGSETKAASRGDWDHFFYWFDTKPTSLEPLIPSIPCPPKNYIIIVCVWYPHQKMLH